MQEVLTLVGIYYFFGLIPAFMLFKKDSLSIFELLIYGPGAAINTIGFLIPAIALVIGTPALILEASIVSITILVLGYFSIYSVFVVFNKTSK